MCDKTVAVWRALEMLLPCAVCCVCCAKSLQLCPTLVTPWTVACQAPLSMGFSRQEYWSRLPFPSTPWSKGYFAKMSSFWAWERLAATLPFQTLLLDFHFSTPSSASLCSQTSCQHPLISATSHQSAISPSFPAHLSTWHHLLLDVYSQWLGFYCCSLQGVWGFPSWPARILFCVISSSSAISESASYFLWGQIPIFIFPLFRSFRLLNPWVC